MGSSALLYRYYYRVLLYRVQCVVTGPLSQLWIRDAGMLRLREKTNYNSSSYVVAVVYIPHMPQQGKYTAAVLYEVRS